jgi:MFS family permease
MTWVSCLFITGFASTALFGPLVGRLCDSYGRKAGTLVFSLLYSLSAMSTKSNILGVLLAGRVMGGIGTSLFSSAPEAWLVGDAARNGLEGSLGETFSLAYAGDSIVAVLAGKMADMAAGSRGPSGPFELSVGFLILGGLLAAFTWKENVSGNVKSGGDDADKDDAGSNPTIRDAVKVVKEDPKIILVGSIQSLFEAAMYIFVLNWPPAVSKAVGAYFAKFATDSTAAISTPYGTVFSCFSKFIYCLLVIRLSLASNYDQTIILSLEPYTYSGMLPPRINNIRPNDFVHQSRQEWKEQGRLYRELCLRYARISHTCHGMRYTLHLNIHPLHLVGFDITPRTINNSISIDFIGG